MIRAPLRIGLAPAAIQAVIKEASAYVILKSAPAERCQGHHGVVPKLGDR